MLTRRHFQVSRKGSRDVADHMAIQMDDSDSITVSEQSEPSAECWQNMYKLLNFYSLISDPTGILEKSSPENCLAGGESALGRQPSSSPSSSISFSSPFLGFPPNRASRILNDQFCFTAALPLCSSVCGRTSSASPEGGRRPSEQLCKVIFENEQQDPNTPNKPPGASGRRRSLVSSEPQHVTLIVFGIGMVNRTHLEADIGGLTMEAELKKIHGSFTLKEKMKGEPSVLFPLPQRKGSV